MSLTRFAVITASVMSVFTGTLVFAQDKEGDKHDKKAPEKTDKKSHHWAVVQVNDELQVIDEERIPELQKEVAKAKKDQEKAKKAGKKGEKPDPKKVMSFSVVKKGFATREEAEKFREKEVEKNDKKAKKDDGKKDKDKKPAKKE